MFVSANYTFAALCNRNTSSSGLMNHMVFMRHVVFLTDSIPGAQLLGIHRGCEMYLVLNGQYQSFKHKPANQLRTSLFFFMCAKSSLSMQAKEFLNPTPHPQKLASKECGQNNTAGIYWAFDLSVPMPASAKILSFSTKHGQVKEQEWFLSHLPLKIN